MPCKSRKIPSANAAPSGGSGSGINTTPVTYSGVNEIKPSQQREDPLNAAYEESPDDKAAVEATANQLNISKISEDKGKFKAVAEGARRVVAADDKELGLKDLDLARKSEGLSKQQNQVIQPMHGEVAYKAAPTAGVHRVAKAEWDTLTAKLRDLESKSSALEQYVLEKKERTRIKEMLRKEAFKMGITGLPDAAFIRKKETQVSDSAVDEMNTKTQKGTIEPGATKKEVEKGVAPTPVKRRVWF